MNTILTARNISKQYRLGLVGTGTLSHDLNRFLHRIRGKEDPYLKIGAENDRASKAKEDYVWALRDINFDVKEGEVLGIIGKNGAGKSTLLKILSRVTMPTTGSIKTKGRIASLLEVGTGFHPELTGRENIYLNGAILGMTKSEIQEKEEEIIDFSGCAMYIDTPVKRYSSGMRVRLAFAVAAHLEPDILVVDEVLAVGDAEFQKKAIGKMKDISGTGGRTVLFVSHNMAAVKSLCTRGVVLENGTSVFEGSAEESVDYYLKMGNKKGAEYLRYFTPDECESFNFRLYSFGVKAANKEFGSTILRSDKIEFHIEFDNYYQEKLLFGLRFKDEKGEIIFVTTDSEFISFKKTKTKLKLEIPNFFFNQGVFFVDIQANDGRNLLMRFSDVLNFSVVQETVKEGYWQGKTPGPLKPNFKWI
ncbi:ABC transporter ATP-binding protein [Psychroflexus halocasei]|uniref:Lipopolysaccharide transport system ATP-binding protein n=1 Tax=Psychroflexus halocasei TaxID=908615 RepID=A0A1H4DBU1_9FLAO|nr:ABC transporter ATP-binding protein [Psychroflexus halocasei]SEA69889.1 lipopolysaccharide transport system ATP-binding protein [Psychroflexus halocasei]